MADNDYLLNKEIKITEQYRNKLDKEINNTKDKFINEIKINKDVIIKNLYPIVKKPSKWKLFKKKLRDIFSKL